MAAQAGIFCSFGEEHLTMQGRDTGTFAYQECSAYLYGIGSQDKSRRDSTGICDRSCGNHGNRYAVCNLWNECEAPCERGLGGLKKGTAMSSSFEAGGHDEIHAGVGDCFCF